MLSGKFLITLLGIIAAIFAVCKTDFGQGVTENFLMYPITTTAVPQAMAPNGSVTAYGGNYIDAKAMMGSGKFVSVPSFQGVLSPRFSNVQYGANIKYNMPDRENLGTPCEPLTFGDMVQENYQQAPKPSPKTVENYGCGTGQSTASCGKGGYGLGHAVAGGYELPTGYTNGNYSDVYNTLTYDGQEAPVVSQPCTDSPVSNADLPVGTMTTMDAAGNAQQFVMFNRLMNVSMKGRNRGAGDPIRGDLAITPCQSGWFSVYPTINADLQPGAMNVLAGAGAGESNAKLMDLLVSASGGARTTFGGVDLSSELGQAKLNMTPQAYASLSQGVGGTVNVTNFP